MYQLQLLGPDGASSSHPLSPRPLHVGRGAGNDLILLDDAASTRHFRAWEDEAGARLEDLGSRNGTWVDGVRVVGLVTLAPGAEVRVGATVRLVVRLAEEGAGAIPQLEDLDLGIRHAIRTDRFVLGPGPGADVRLGAGEEDVTLVVDREGVVRLGRGGDLTDIALDEPFTVAGRRFCLRRPRTEGGATRDLVLPHELPRTRYPYALALRPNAPTGPVATLQHLGTGALHTIEAENPALLLYLLGRRFAEELAAGTPPADAGWVSDDELAVGIWGRAEAGRQAGHLNVLVWRVRRELQGAGFDPWCLEKRRRFLRARVERVTLA